MLQHCETAPPPPPAQHNQGCQSYSPFHHFLKTIIQRDQRTVTHDASFQRKSRASESLTLLRAASVRRNPARTVRSDNTNSTWWNNIAITSTTLTTGQTNIAKHHKTSSHLFTMFWQMEYFISIFPPIKKSNFAIQRWLIQILKTTVTSRHGRQGSCMFEFSQFSKLFFFEND